MTTFRPYWFDEALKREGDPQSRSLMEDIRADICIVGGGYTGLWTALELKAGREDLDVVVIEQDLCGHGASGCNGGCVLTLATRFRSLSRFYGRSEARRLGPRGLFPPEPVRWLGAMTVRNAIRRKEAAEDAGRSPRRLDTRLARFAAAAGKADK